MTTASRRFPYWILVWSVCLWALFHYQLPFTCSICFHFSCENAHRKQNRQTDKLLSLNTTDSTTRDMQAVCSRSISRSLLSDCAVLFSSHVLRVYAQIDMWDRWCLSSPRFLLLPFTFLQFFTHLCFDIRSSAHGICVWILISVSVHTSTSTLCVA